MANKKPVVIMHEHGENIKKSLGTIKKNEFRSRYLDYRINRIFSKLGPDQEWFNKHILLKIIQNRVSRPDHELFEFDTHFDGTIKPLNIKTEDLNKIAAFLEKHKTIFFKYTGFFSAGGKYVIRMSLDEKSITLELTNTENIEDFIKHFDQKQIRILGNKIIINRYLPLKEIIAKLIVITNFERIAIEEEVKMPLYNGSKWEIRTLVQSPNGKPFIIGGEAKVGPKKSIVANIAKGGKSIDPAKLISDLYKQFYPKANEAQIAKLTEEFFKKVKEQTNICIDLMNQYIKIMGEELMPNYPLERLYIRESAVDFHAIFNPRTGKLEPLLNEIQYPKFGVGVKDWDPLTTRLYWANRKRILRRSKADFAPFKQE